MLTFYIWLKNNFRAKSYQNCWATYRSRKVHKCFQLDILHDKTFKKKSIFLLTIQIEPLYITKYRMSLLVPLLFFSSTFHNFEYMIGYFRWKFCLWNIHGMGSDGFFAFEMNQWYNNLHIYILIEVTTDLSTFLRLVETTTRHRLNKEKE